jgi:hypothetical protein
MDSGGDRTAHRQFAAIGVTIEAVAAAVSGCLPRQLAPAVTRRSHRLKRQND